MGSRVWTVANAMIVGALLALSLTACSSSGSDSDSGVCEPVCSGRDCGDDGCGGTCGSCDGNSFCALGQCVCQPQCGLNVCGDDGCGGTCGTCPTGFACDAGECLCAPDCGDRSCGDDGCWGSCGTCGSDELCVTGECCEPDCAPGQECGDDGCGGECGSCPGGVTCADGICDCTSECVAGSCAPDACGQPCPCADGEACVGTTCCAQDCEGKTCGPDGCGGSCGECAEGSETCVEIDPSSGARECVDSVLAGYTCPAEPAANPPSDACATDEDCPADGVCQSLCGWRTCVCGSDADCPAAAAACKPFDATIDLQICTVTCADADGCPAGLPCQGFWIAETETSLCAPPLRADDCLACTTNETCELVGDVCGDVDASGPRCFAACGEGGTCPDGFSCTTLSGGEACIDAGGCLD